MPQEPTQDSSQDTPPVVQDPHVAGVAVAQEPAAVQDLRIPAPPAKLQELLALRNANTAEDLADVRDRLGQSFVCRCTLKARARDLASTALVTGRLLTI